VIGRKITWTVRVTNNSTVDAADVNIVKVSERSYRSKLLSVEPSQGTCNTTACSLGRLAAGATATITVVSRATRVGTILHVVHVGSEEQESNYLNNTASAVVRVTSPVSEAVKGAATALSCHTLVAAPSSLRKGATSIVLTKARTRFGNPVGKLTVRILGQGIDLQARTNTLGIARFVITPASSGIVTVERTRRLTSAVGPRCRTLLGVLGAVHPEVTG
jgi:hypothetical protein